MNFSDGVSGKIFANDSSLTLSKNNWFVSSYGSYDTFSISGIAPVNISTEKKTFTYKVTLACTSSDDLAGLNNNSTDFLVINLSVNPSSAAPIDPQEPVVKDTTAPVITLVGSPEVTVEAGTAYVDQGATATDDVDGDITSHIVVSNPVDTFQLGVYTVTYKVQDSAGNNAGVVRNVTVVDTTAPVISAPGDVEIVLAGSLTPVNIGNAAATDLFLKDITNNAPQDGFRLGTTTVTWTATDTSGNMAAATQKVTVKYAFAGILKPINQDGSSLFKAGSTIPVKFHLKDSKGAYVSTANATLSYAKLTDNVSKTALEAVSTSNSTTGNAFRYDATSNQYIFNMNTKGLTPGTYLLTINLDDGMAYFVKISLK